MAFKIMKLLTHVLLPILLFSLLAHSASRLILRQSLVENGLRSKMAAICTPGLAPHPYRLQYTGNLQIDNLLCRLVIFFHALMDTTYFPLNAALYPALGIIILIPLIEAVRDRRPLILGAPTPVGVILQLYSMGFIIPIYSLFFVITGAASIRPSHTTNPPSKIDRANAESLLFGFVVGYVLPTVLMLHFITPSMTAIWQGFPILIAIATLAYRLLPSSPNIRSGHPTIMATLTLAFVLSGLLHAVYIWPLLPDIEALRTLFVPINVADVVDFAATPIPDGAHGFIKWDIIFAMGSMMLATLWMADTVLNFVGIIVWYGIATIVFGPAAAIAGVFMWRERRLNGQNHGLLKKTVTGTLRKTE